MGKLRDNLNLIFSNLLFGANFSIYVSLVRNWFDFRQLFLLQVGAAALFFIPFALLSPRTPRMRWGDLKNILMQNLWLLSKIGCNSLLHIGLFATNERHFDVRVTDG